MKLIATRRRSHNPGDRSPFADLNSGVGTIFKVMPASEVDAYIALNTERGFVCYEFQHTGTYQTQTTIIKTQAA